MAKSVCHARGPREFVVWVAIRLQIRNLVVGPKTAPNRQILVVLACREFQFVEPGPPGSRGEKLVSSLLREKLIFRTICATLLPVGAW